MRLRRKAEVDPTNEATTDEPVDEAPLAHGPLDADDLDLEDDASFADHIDLGGLLVAPPPEGIDLRLQVDEESGTVLAVLLAGEDGALELRPFASRRGGDLWGEVRPQIASETARHGGTATEREGDFGTELVCMVPVTTPDGEAATQPSRVIGCNGPRWFLRATLLGLPAIEPEQAGIWEDAIRSTVVRRGAGAMPPGESLPLTLPPGAERV